MKFLLWKFRLWLYIKRHCEFTNGWQGWADWREMYDFDLSPAEAFAEAHRDV